VSDLTVRTRLHTRWEERKVETTTNSAHDNGDRDQELLASLERKLQLIRDRTQGVAEGFSNGFYLWGPGGVSKSYTVEQTLRRLRKPFLLSNSRVTGKGLFNLLRDHPDAAVRHRVGVNAADPKAS
jgi:hypothetical protein